MNADKCVKYSTVPVHVPSTLSISLSGRSLNVLTVHLYHSFSTPSPVQVQGGLCI